MLIQRICDLCQPGPIFDQSQNFRRREEFDAVGRPIPQRLEQPCGHQNRHVMRLPVQHPGRLRRFNVRKQILRSRWDARRKRGAPVLGRSNVRATVTLDKWGGIRACGACCPRGRGRSSVAYPTVLAVWESAELLLKADDLASPGRRPPACFRYLLLFMDLPQSPPPSIWGFSGGPWGCILPGHSHNSSFAGRPERPTTCGHTPPSRPG